MDTAEDNHIELESKPSIKVHSNFYNIVMGFLLKVSQVLFPLITFPYVSRVLLAEGVGRVNFAQSTLSLLSTLAMLGIPIYGIKACAKVRDDKVRLATTVKELLVINSFSMVVSYILLVICVLFIDKIRTDLILFAVMSMTIAFTVFGVEWFYQAIEQYDYITIRSVIVKALSVILMFIIVRNAGDVVQYGFIVVLGTVGSNILNIIRLHRFVSLKSAEKMNLRHHLKPILTLFAFSATTTFYTSLNTVMLGLLKSDAEVGFFSAADKIKGLGTQIVTIASSVLLPRSAYLLEQRRKDEFHSLIKSSLQFSLVISCPMIALCIINAHHLIMILSGSGFMPAIPVMQIEIIATMFIGLTNVIGVQLFIPMDREKYVFHSTLCGAIAGIILNSLLIPTLGASGAAISTVSAEATVLIVQLILLRKLRIKVIAPSELIKILTSTALASCVAYFASNLFSGIISSLVISCLTFGLVYLGLLLLSREKALMLIIRGRME